MLDDPDWLTHVLVAWTLSRLLQIRFKQFDDKSTAIVMVGALVPDIVKIATLFDFFRINACNFLAPFHTPVGALLSSALISLLFQESSLAFGMLVLGASTHFALDFCLKHVAGGMPLLFPFSYDSFDAFVLMNDWSSASVIIPILLLALLGFFVGKEVTRGTKNIWKRLLVE